MTPNSSVTESSPRPTGRAAADTLVSVPGALDGY
ncbi:hypothetical protein ABIB34_002268 [Rhodococcus sp. UYP5]